MKRCLIVFIVSLFFIEISFAQTGPRFWNDVQIIKDFDKMYKPLPDPILFIGSSSIRKWDDLQQVFGNYNVLNRGIGGAVINDISYYLNDIVFPYQPRQIVLYVGENDLVEKNVTADTILNRIIKLYGLIRTKLPDVPIVYIAMKPSPVRDRYMQTCLKANLLIQNFISKQKNSTYIDIFSLMLTKDGKSKPELFVKDQLHMNLQGYAIWEKAVRPYLLKN